MMSPSVTQSEIDDTTLIEAEIQNELDLIDLDTEEVNNNSGEAAEQVAPDAAEHDGEHKFDELQDYLQHLKTQTDRFENELLECDILINHHKPDGFTETVETMELLEEAQLMGVDPKELHRKILEEIAKQDETDTLEENERYGISNGDASVFVASDPALLTEEKPKEETLEEPMEVSTLKPEEGVVAVVDDIQHQEAFFKKQLQDLILGHQEKENKWKQNLETQKKEEENREMVENERRQQIKIQLEQEEKALTEQKQLAQEKLKVELETKQRIIQMEVNKFQEEIIQLEERTRQEQAELNEAVQVRQKKTEVKKIEAAEKIQAGFRGYRVRKLHQGVLQEKREERAKHRELKRIEEVEGEIRQRKEESEKKEREERERREKEERKKQEELKQIEEEKKQVEEKRKEEIRKKEEEKRLEEERQKEIQLQKEREEERKIAEQKRIDELKKQEDERSRKEEERLKEEQRLAEIKKREDEERERKEQEEREREELERRRKEEEEQRKREELEKQIEMEAERKKKEQEEKERTEKEEKEKEEVEKLRNQEETKFSKKVGEHQTSRHKYGEKESQVSENRSEIIQDSVETHGNILPSHIEAKRLVWIKECLPWSKVSNEPWKLKGGVSKKPPRRPPSAKKLPPLSEDVVIAAAQVASLKQVTTVQLSDLPGCTLSTLGQCWGLKSLTMTNCNLLSVDGINQCRQLQYLCMKSNRLEYMDVKDLGNLQVLDLSHNHISVVHGLDGCTNIRWLDLSSNRITRLGGLDPLRRLHTLILSHNQLINCDSIDEVPTLQHLDVSHNHIQKIDKLQKLCLLQRLMVATNNLLQLPDLRNQVLLQECDLSDNSISSLEGLCTTWLPSLQNLNLAKNSLSSLKGLESLILLQSLDVSNNQFLDLGDFMESLSCLSYLEQLNLHDNPVADGTSFKDNVLKTLPRLKSLDDFKSGGSMEAHVLQPRTDFETMCLNQLQAQDQIRTVFLQNLRALQSRPSVDDTAVCETYFRYCDKSFRMAVEHRYSHEYGEVSVHIPAAPTTPRSDGHRASKTKPPFLPESYLSPKEMFEKALNTESKKDPLVLENQSNRDYYVNPKDLFDKAVRSSEMPVNKNANQDNETGHVEDMQNGRIVCDQPCKVQDAIPTPSDLKLTQAEEDTNIRDSLKNLPPDELAILEELHSAATKIQSTWRGYILRVKLNAALEYARLEGDDDISELEDFNMDEIAFDEESLEKGWRPAETPMIPTSHPVLNKPPSGRRSGPDILKLDLVSPHPPNRPRQAWRNMDSPLSDIPAHVPRPPSSVRTASDTHRTGLSKREEKLAEEWGFHNSRTAELMLQRAKKMKLNSEKKKKLSKLDPKQRLALFRKLEETTKLAPIRPQFRRTLPRKEYFQAREDEILRKEADKQKEVEVRNVRTYEWLHTQVGSVDHSEGTFQRKSNFGSEGNIHQAISEFVAARKHLQGGLDADSYCSEERKQRRFSSGESMSGQTTYLPPIKTNSAGSGGSGGRRREKISWRSKPTEMDIGWGGGRKRQAHK